MNLFKLLPSGSKRSPRSLVLASGLFDAAYYRMANPDLARAGIDPLDHYLDIGWREGRQPSAEFDAQAYLEAYPDVAAANLNPLLHWIVFGQAEGRARSKSALARKRQERSLVISSGLFDAEYYRASNPDVAGAGINPLDHYLDIGWREGRQPSAKSDARAYLEANPDGAAAGLKPPLHSIVLGQAEGRVRSKSELARKGQERSLVASSGLFDAEFYRASNPEVAEAGIDPLDHYLDIGWREGRQPSTEFDAQAYLEANPDVAAANLNPLLHWIVFGQAEGRARSKSALVRKRQERSLVVSSGLFDAEFYRVCNPKVAGAGIDPLDHYLDIGWREGRQPSAEFDAQAYLEANPDVEAANLNPLLHWIVFGQAEGRPLPACTLARSQRAAALDRIVASGWFDSSFYMQQAPALEGTAIDPALHYLIEGYKSFLEPSPKLSMKAYLGHWPSSRIRGSNPLLDFIAHGCPVSDALPNSEKVWRRAQGDLLQPLDLLRHDIMAATAYGSRFNTTTGEAKSAFDNAVSKLKSCQPLTARSDQALVAIIANVSGEAAILLDCLDSIVTHETRFRLNIVLIDARHHDGDRSDLDLLDLPAVPWLDVVGPDDAELQRHLDTSRPDFIVYLGTALRLADRCLDRLIESFDAFPDADIIVPRVLRVERSKAGCEPSFIGEAQANAPDACYVRDVPLDQEMIHVAVKVAAWTKYRNFSKSVIRRDEVFLQSDSKIFCFYQPLAALLQVPFPPRRRDVERPQPDDMPRWQTNEPAVHSQRSRLLVLDALTPTPDKDSGSFITAEMLKAFRELDIDVTFFATHSPEWDADYVSSLQGAGIRCLYAPYFNSVEQIVQTYAFDYVLAYRVTVLHPHLAVIRRHAALARVIFHNVDLHYLRLEREARLTASVASQIEASHLQTMELEMFARADCSIVHTPVEKSLVMKQAPLHNIVEFPYIAAVRRSNAAFEARHDIMFLGGYAHSPNVDAVKFFTDNVWPLLVDKLPKKARFLIVGASPPASVKALADDRIVVTGLVPDLKHWFDQAKVSVAPLRYGAGIKGKLIQSLAHGVPSVATSIAAEGIGVDDGRHVIVADDAEAIAVATLELYQQKERWLRMQEEGYSFVEQNFSWLRGLEICREVLKVADTTWLAREKIRRERLIQSILEEEGHRFSGS